jgi:hypothetical protein
VIVSAIWFPMRCTGFSACIAPWNTTDIPDHRTARSRPGFIAITSTPFNRTSPVTVVFGGTSRRTAFTIVDLPHPDSPARPSTSPLSTVRSTPRTAGTGPAWVWYVTVRSRTDSTLIGLSAPAASG